MAEGRSGSAGGVRGNGGRGPVRGFRGAPPPAREETVSAARRAAFRVLLEVEQGRGHSDELLYASGSGAALDGLGEADRNLAMALVMGVLRWQIALDRRLRALFSRPEAVVANEVMLALRMGAFQLLHLDRIPAHAALSESVALARAAGQEHATGMVNAVLRKIAAGPKAEPAKVFETVAAMAGRLGHPAWLVERWVEHYGRAAAARICEADQSEPGVAGIFAEETGEGLPSMDEGSRLVAEMAAVAAPATGGRGLRVWDCCAAPGNKTAVLANRLRQLDPAGLEVVASDVSGRRLRAMEARMGGLAASAGEGGPVRCLVADASALPPAEGMFDLVLCDVPCSGTGTLGRNPEIRLQVTAAELTRQALRQRSILAAAMGRVRAGGRLVYSTCSLEPEECEEVVAAVMGGMGGWRRLEAGPMVEQALGGTRLNGAVREGSLRTLPGVDPVDGFYAATLEREV